MPGLHAAESESSQTSLAAQANNEFATDLYHQLAQESAGNNLFFSPYSLFSALLMTAEGARGETARQMGTVLRFPEVARTMGDPAARSEPLEYGHVACRDGRPEAALDRRCNT
jgi:serine protease inhibitor